MFATQTACLLALIAWSVHHVPGDTGGAKPSAPAAAAGREGADDAVIDNSEDTAENTSAGTIDARYSVPPTVRFRTENPPAGSLNLRPVEGSSPRRADPWQPVHPQNPPQRLPGGTRSPFEVSGKGATVYNAPPPDAE